MSIKKLGGFLNARKHTKAIRATRENRSTIRQHNWRSRILEMSYIESFKKAQGGKVYCYGLTKPENTRKNLFGKHIATIIDTALYPEIFKKTDSGLSAIAICIEPMTPEQKQQLWNGIKVERTQGSKFQDNTACLLFGDVESIDGMIKGLQRCKKRLKEKIKEREWEEYRKKYYGKVIRFSDILERKSNSTESLGKVEKPCFQ